MRPGPVNLIGADIAPAETIVDSKAGMAPPRRVATDRHGC